MKKTLDVKVVNDLAELKTVIGLLRNAAAFRAETYGEIAPADSIYIVNDDGDPVTLTLVEEVLSDGSKVYNVVVS